MTEQKDIADIRLLGGHPALDFVNTVDAWRDRWGPDYLAGYGDLIQWAERIGLVDSRLSETLRQKAEGSPSEAEAALARARSLRESLHALFLTEAGAAPFEPRDCDRLNAVIGQAGGHRGLVYEAKAFRWAWRAADDLDTIVDRIAFAAADLLASRPDRREVRECHGLNCGWLFLDSSRAGRRIWCSEETCGTHMRVRRFRRKDGPPKSAVTTRAPRVPRAKRK